LSIKWLITGRVPSEPQPAWYGVDVPKTGSTIRVDGFGKMGDQINVTVN
jgi:immune inhibitor A